MKSVIYYFSGTGNSLYAAKYIAKRIDADVIALAGELKKERVLPEADCIGIVFPVYFASNKDGVPLAVKRFARLLSGIEDKYIFAVCTSGYTPGSAIGELGKTIKRRGGRLSAGFVVNMSQASLSQELSKKAQQIAGKDKGGKAKPGKLTINPNEKLNVISEAVKKRKHEKLETRSVFKTIANAPLKLLMKPIFWARYAKLTGKRSADFWKLVPYCDNAFITNEACTGCGTCEKICPVANISLVNSKPKWNHSCENCLACYSWCPQGAIEGALVKYNSRSTHPEISLSEMLR
jgi:ferredoxin/flavodoxin